MKLNKIAALALAGVMAVSMLAGCAGKNTTDNGASSTPTTPAASGYSAKLGEILKAEGNEKVTYSDSTATTSLLTSTLAQVELKGVDLGKIGSTAAVKVDGSNPSGATSVIAINTKAQELAGNSIVNYSATALAAITGKETADSKTTTVTVYAVDGNFTESKALDLIAAQVDSATDGLVSQKLSYAADKLVSAKYTGSMSMQKVSADGVSAWVAVVVLNADVTVEDAPAKGQQ